MAQSEYKSDIKKVYKIGLNFKERQAQICEDIREHYQNENLEENELRRFELAVYAQLFQYPYSAIISKEEFIKHLKMLQQTVGIWRRTKSIETFCTEFGNIVDYGRLNGGCIAEYKGDSIEDIFGNYASALAKIEIANYDITRKYVEEVRFVLWEKDCGIDKQ